MIEEEVILCFVAGASISEGHKALNNRTSRVQCPLSLKDYDPARTVTSFHGQGQTVA